MTALQQYFCAEPQLLHDDSSKVRKTFLTKKCWPHWEHFKMLFQQEFANIIPIYLWKLSMCSGFNQNIKQLTTRKTIKTEFLQKHPYEVSEYVQEFTKELIFLSTSKTNETEYLLELTFYPSNHANPYEGFWFHQRNKCWSHVKPVNVNSFCINCRNIL